MKKSNTLPLGSSILDPDCFFDKSNTVTFMWAVLLIRSRLDKQVVWTWKLEHVTLPVSLRLLDGGYEFNKKNQTKYVNVLLTTDVDENCEWPLNERSALLLNYWWKMLDGLNNS